MRKISVEGMYYFSFLSYQIMNEINIINQIWGGENQSYLIYSLNIERLEVQGGYYKYY